MFQKIKTLLGCLAMVFAGSAHAADGTVEKEVVHYRVAKVDGLEIFYREAGSANAQTVLLLHGFPTSSHMFRDLIPLLADRYHVVAPDYLGFGNSSTPDVATFNYTFDHLAEVMQDFIDVLGLKSYALYLQDFGGPVGFRLAAKRPRTRAGAGHPERKCVFRGRNP